MKFKPNKSRSMVIRKWTLTNRVKPHVHKEVMSNQVPWKVV